MSREPRFGVIQKMRLNGLARGFYMMMGYTVPEGYDFSKASHPQERMVWQQAILAWKVLVDR